MEITIKLYGNLRRFGNEFKLKEVDNVADAMQALYCQINGFRLAIQKGLFQVKFNEKMFSMETLKEDMLETVENFAILHIIPVFAGSGGAIQMVVGAVMVVVGVLTSWTGVGAYVGAMGVALMASGVATMLTQTPQTDVGRIDEKEKQQSTSFSNLQNLVAQGRPVPLAYGKIMVGSLVIGKGLETRTIQLHVPSTNKKDGFWGLSRGRR